MTRSVSAALGALIVIAMRFTDRAIGVISTMILARILLPADFGIIAMSFVVVGLVDVLLDLGVAIVLVQKSHATQDDYDAAWTLRLIQSAIAALVVFAAAYPANNYFHDARVTSVIQVLALATFIAGFENIGIVTFQKRMEFGQEFRFFFAKRMAGFLATLIAALLLHSYWAMVIGTLVGRAVGVLLSYAMHPMRPRWQFAHIRSILSFSSWNLIRGIGAYLMDNLHRLLVGRRENASVMGAYSLASDITAIPTTELLAPMNRVLFPLLVAAKDSPQQFKDLFLRAIGVQALLGIPAGVGLALVAPELVRALLGERWMMAVPFVQIMGGTNVVTALMSSSGYVLLALGKANASAGYGWLQVAIFASLAVLLIPDGGALAIAQLRLGVAFVGLLIFVGVIRRQYPLWTRSDLLQSVWRPCLAAGVMALVLHALPAMSGLPALAALLLKGVLGAAIYAGALFVLWRLAGQPAGAESYLLAQARAALKR